MKSAEISPSFKFKNLKSIASKIEDLRKKRINVFKENNESNSNHFFKTIIASKNHFLEKFISEQRTNSASLVRIRMLPFDHKSIQIIVLGKSSTDSSQSIEKLFRNKVFQIEEFIKCYNIEMDRKIQAILNEQHPHV